MKIAILVPFYKFLPSKSAKCLIDLAILLKVHGIGYSFISKSDTYLHQARESLFDLFDQERKKRDYDWVLHIDSDQTFSVEDVLTLLKHAEENDFPVLSGIYFGEQSGRILPVLLKKLDKKTALDMARVRNCDPGEIKASYYRIAALPDKPFFEVGVIGFGFMVCRPKVYDDIVEKFGRPIFAPEMDKKANKIVGEDVTWCERARACGHKVMVDRNVIIGHMGGEITYKDYRAWLAEASKGIPLKGNK